MVAVFLMLVAAACTDGAAQGGGSAGIVPADPSQEAIIDDETLAEPGADVEPTAPAVDLVATTLASMSVEETAS